MRRGLPALALALLLLSGACSDDGRVEYVERALATLERDVADLQQQLDEATQDAAQARREADQLRAALGDAATVQQQLDDLALALEELGTGEGSQQSELTEAAIARLAEGLAQLSLGTAASSTPGGSKACVAWYVHGLGSPADCGLALSNSP